MAAKDTELVPVRLHKSTLEYIDRIALLAGVTRNQATSVMLALSLDLRVGDIPNGDAEPTRRPHPDTGELADPGSEWVVDYDRSMGANIVYKQVPVNQAADITGRCQRHVQPDPQCDACNGWPNT